MLCAIKKKINYRTQRTRVITQSTPHVCQKPRSRYLKKFDISNLYRQNLSVRIGWTQTSRDQFEISASVSSAVVLRIDASDRMNATLLLRASQSVSTLARGLNCWTAAITKKHRNVYMNTYPTILVLPDGSSINIEYHEPRQIITLPLNISELSEAEQKRRLLRRKPKTKIVLVEEIQDDFDEFKYLKKK